VRATVLTPAHADLGAQQPAVDPGNQLRRPLATQTSLLGDLVESSAIKPGTSRGQGTTTPRPLGGPRRWPFAYVQRGARDPRFDLLRGLCLLVMVINNLGGNSWLYAATGAGVFYLSAAEGFIFIAGCVLGFTAARETLGEAVRHLVERLWTLYRLALGITLGFAVLATNGRLALWYPLPEATVAAYAGHPDAFVVGTLGLSVAYHGGEYLVLLILLLAATPLALLACAEGRGWLVPVVSIGIYLAAQLYPDQFRLPFATYLSLEAWQLLFFSGLTIGYHRTWFGEQLARFRPYWFLYAGLITIAAIVLIVLYRQHATPLWLFDRENVEAARVALTPRRLLLVAIYLQFFYLLVTWFWVPLRTALGWFVLSLGRNSLWIYALHLPLIVLFRSAPFLTDLDRNLGTVAQLLAIALLWGSVKLRDWANGAAYRAALPASRSFRSLAQRES
jgi:hypothetical protein